MKIRFLSGPRKDEITHAPKSQQTDLLIGAGLIEVLDESDGPRVLDKHDVAPPFHSTPVWSYAIVATTHRPAIRYAFASEIKTYANWDDQPAKFVVEAARKAGCPEDIIERYSAEIDRWTKTERERHAANNQAMAANRTR